MMDISTAFEGVLHAAQDQEPVIVSAAKALGDAAVRSNDRKSAELQKGIKKLRGLRAHRAVEIVAQELESVGIRPAWLLRFHAQALLERGAYYPALGLLAETRRMALDEGDVETETDSWGLQGRVFKDLYRLASTRDPVADWSVCEEFLKRSAEAYSWGYARKRGTPDAHFFGGNLLGLSAMAQRAHVALPLATAPNEIANGIVNDVLPRAGLDPSDAAAPSAWDFGSVAEALAYLGRWEEAKVMIGKFLTARYCDAFSINSTLRQFEQVWGVSPDEPDKAEITNLLRLALITADGGSIRLEEGGALNLIKTSAVSGPQTTAATRDAQERYEKVFGKEGPYGFGRLQQIINYSHAVGRVMIDTARVKDYTIGTGFLIAGASVHASMEGQCLFLTNAHVISPNPADGPGAAPGEARIRFDASQLSEEFVLDDLVWSSPPIEHDVSIFRLPGNCSCADELNRRAALIKIAAGLPKLKQKEVVKGPNGEDRTIERATGVYVIGYPLGQELSFSLSDNELIDYENVYGVAPGPEPRKLHYRAPTEPGNSGSPVFNSRTMELVAIHHAGGSRKRLNGLPGMYLANEGLWLRPLFNACRMELGLT